MDKTSITAGILSFFVCIIIFLWMTDYYFVFQLQKSQSFGICHIPNLSKHSVAQHRNTDEMWGLSFTNVSPSLGPISQRYCRIKTKHFFSEGIPTTEQKTHQSQNEDEPTSFQRSEHRTNHSNTSFNNLLPFVCLGHTRYVQSIISELYSFGWHSFLRRQQCRCGWRLCRG